MLIALEDLRLELRLEAGMTSNEIREPRGDIRLTPRLEPYLVTIDRAL